MPQDSILHAWMRTAQICWFPLHGLGLDRQEPLDVAVVTLLLVSLVKVRLVRKLVLRILLHLQHTPKQSVEIHLGI